MRAVIHCYTQKYHRKRRIHIYVPFSASLGRQLCSQNTNMNLYPYIPLYDSYIFIYLMSLWLRKDDILRNNKFYFFIISPEPVVPSRTTFIIHDHFLHFLKVLWTRMKKWPYFISNLSSHSLHLKTMSDEKLLHMSYFHFPIKR